MTPRISRCPSLVLLLIFCAMRTDLCARTEELSQAARELTQVWDGKGERPVDKRHDAPRTLLQGSSFVPPGSRDEWMARAAQLRTQVLVAAGLFPLPERTPLNAVVHGKIERGDYTVEKVFFESYPGFFVSGNLYRPVVKAGRTGPYPGVISPHGHWKDGRFFEAPENEVKKQLDGGWETDADAARYPLQARCANLAKLGCVVFHYDMVGYADSNPKNFPHRATWLGAKEEMNSLGILGLQLWDSMRALDFLESLPDVDKSRLACTGASGGATQTFLLMATDDRLSCAAPVCMLSAGDHQGGCVCENAALLRVFTDNIELAACFAPKPFIHPSATGDWTKDFMEHGFPEIKAVYRLFGAEENVEALRQKADHNYNLKAREAVYNFFNKHLKLGNPAPVRESKFAPLKPSELSVFDAAHPRPANAVNSEQLKVQLIASSRKQIDALLPKDAEGLKKFRAVMEPALTVLCSAQKFQKTNYESKNFIQIERPDFEVKKYFFSGSNGALIPTNIYISKAKHGFSDAVMIVQPGGKSILVKADGTPSELLAALLKHGYGVIALDLFGENENAGELAGFKTLDHAKDFFAGYNPTIIANRAQDILACASILKTPFGTLLRLTLLGLGEDGSACLLAAALDSSKFIFDRVIVEVEVFDFDQVKDYNDSRFLPGAVKFGGLYAFGALVAPVELHVYNAKDTAIPVLQAAYTAANAKGKLKLNEVKLQTAEIIDLLAK